MNELRRLTWKYFWKQKAKEILKALLVIVGILILGVIVYFIGGKINLFMIQKYPNWCGQDLVCGLDDNIGFGMVSLIPLGIVIFGLYRWIKSNWRLASQRAEQELNPGTQVEEEVELE